MKKTTPALLRFLVFGGLALLIMGAQTVCLNWSLLMAQSNQGKVVKLPPASRDSRFSLEKAMDRRHSVRHFTAQALTIEQVSQLLWAAQGLNRPARYRTAPSAGALYPLETYILVGRVADLEPGIYKYQPASHELVLTTPGDRRAELSRAALRQGSIKRAPVVMVLCAVFDRITGKYGRRGIQYTFMEAGHAAQNFLLQAVALELGAVPVGAFSDHKVKAVLELPANEEPLYLLAVGKP